MADDEQFSLCWNNFNSNLSAGFHESLCRGDLVDVTLAAEGQFVKAHRLVLSVCSPYFRKMFTQMPANQHAFVFLKDVSHTALKDLIQFMYCGEVNVKQEALPAFISTAEALQIKGLTDGDPPQSQSPAEPSTPVSQVQQQISSPRVRQQRTSATRSYKIETVEDSDDNKQTTTQIVIAPAPQQTQTITTHHPAQQTATTTTAVVTQKRPAQRSLASAHVKRTKSTIDPLEGADVTPSTQQITMQTAVVTAPAETKIIQQAQSETEYIDLPIELPTKSEPDYSEDVGGDVDTNDQDTAYVEDDSYGDMRYDDTYFTENEDGGNVTTGSTGNVSGATTSKAVIKQQQSSFTDSSYVDTGDQTTNDAQDNKSQLLFVESPWSTPCLVLNDYMYNCHSRKNNKEYWRCHNYSKKIQAERCRSRCVLEFGKLRALSGGSHNHPPHLEKIEKMIQRNRLNSMNHNNINVRTKITPQRRLLERSRNLDNVDTTVVETVDGTGSEQMIITTYDRIEIVQGEEGEFITS